MKHTDFQELETPRLRLRRLSMADLEDYYRHLGGSAAVTRYMLWKPHRDISESEASIRKTLRRYEAGACHRWAITEKVTGGLLGIIDLLPIPDTDDACSFAYMLREDSWGRGYGTESLRAVLSFAFEKLRVHTVTADHFAANPASGRVMEKAGMRRIGLVQEKYEKDGIRHDAIEYRITAEEWISTK